jgi:hypothetical protein
MGIFARLLGIVWNFPKKEGLCCGVLDESINQSRILSKLRTCNPKKCEFFLLELELATTFQHEE